MTEDQAKRLAALLDEIAEAPGAHEAWNSGGGIWLVTAHRDSAEPAFPSAMIVYSGDAIGEYADDEDFDEGRARAFIHTANIFPDPNHDRGRD